MRLSLIFSAALAGITAAAPPQPAQVFILRPKQQQASEKPPSIPRHAALLLVQQRLYDQYGLLDGPTHQEEVVSWMNSYGKPVRPLFSGDASDGPSQLVVMVEGLDANDAKLLETVHADLKVAFTILDPPSSIAHQKLMESHSHPSSVPETPCEFSRAINPLDKDCWSGSSSIVTYDVQKDSTLLQSLRDSIPTLMRLAEIGEMETTIMLFPESTRLSKHNSWSLGNQDLRRRQAEAVMTAGEPEKDDTPSSSPTQHFPGLLQRATIPDCFQTLNSCITATANCSGHGLCINRWAKEVEDPKRPVCFGCTCLRTVAENNQSVTHWAGPMCQKIDVSTPFSLFVLFTILMVGILAFAINMLFQAGEEKLPGVIGAGVSKAK